MALVILVEMAAAHVQPAAAWGLYVVLLAGLLAYAGIEDGKDAGRVSLALTALPLMRIVGYAVTANRLTGLPAYGLAAAMTAVAILWLVPSLGCRPPDLGLSLGYGWIKLVEYLPVAAAGVPAGLLDAYLLRGSFIVQSAVPVADVKTLLAAGFGLALIEELLFRGIMLKVFRDTFGTWPGILCLSVLYGASQLGYGSLPHAALATAMSLLFAWAVTRTRSLYLAALGHAIVNVTVLALVPLWLRG